MARKLEVEIVGDASSLHKALGTADDKASGFGRTLGNLGKVAGLAAGAAGIAGLTYAVKSGIGEWSQSEKVTAQTRAVIKSTGGSANVTTSQIQGLSESLMKKSGVDDEVIQSGANMLLTFRGIRNEAGKGNDVFNQATGTVLDMSVALGEDAPAAAMQLGKALNDPIKGITALRRVGVQFTKAQQDSIAAMVKSGDTMGAQKAILKELNSEFGGSAEAIGKTLPGQINIARETFNNWMGDLVGKAIPVIQETIAWLRDHWPEITAKMQAFWGSVQPILQGFADLALAVVGVIRDNWTTIGPIVDSVARIIKDDLRVVADILKILAALLRGDWSQAWHDFKDAISAEVDAIKTEITLKATLIANAATALGKGIWNAIMAALRGIGGAAWGIINDIGSIIAGKAGAILSWGEGIGSKIKSATLNAVTGIGGAVWGVVNDIGSVLRGHAGAIAGWGEDVGSAIFRGIKNGLSGLAGWVRDAVRAAVNSVVDLFNRVTGAFDFPYPQGVHWHTFHGVPTGVPSIDWGHLHLPRLSRLASGGDLAAMQMAIVGERGPELFMPSSSGTVIPNGAIGGTNVYVNVEGSLIRESQLEQMIARAVRDERLRGNPALA